MCGARAQRILFGKFDLQKKQESFEFRYGLNTRKKKLTPLSLQINKSIVLLPHQHFSQRASSNLEEGVSLWVATPLYSTPDKSWSAS